VTVIPALPNSSKQINHPILERFNGSAWHNPGENGGLDLQKNLRPIGRLILYGLRLKLLLHCRLRYLRLSLFHQF
jgi:hypothetical protein